MSSNAGEPLRCMVGGSGNRRGLSDWNCQPSFGNLCISTGDRAEGAENKTSDRANNNRVHGNSGGGKGRSQSSTSLEGQALETRMKHLSLQCSKGRDGIIADIKMVQIG